MALQGTSDEEQDREIFEHFAERRKKLSEGQRIEFRRRLDHCYAVMAAAESPILEQQRAEEEIKQQSAFAEARWPWGIFIGAVVVAWGGKQLEIAFITSIAYGVGFLVICAFLHSGWKDWDARRRIAEQRARLAQLLFQWMAAGANAEAFRDYCARVAKNGARPNTDEILDIHSSMRRSLLTCVDDLTAGG